MPRPHPPEFRRRAVELANQRARSRATDSTVAKIAEDLAISDSCLHNWTAQAAVDTGQRPGLSSDERRELVELRRRTQVLQMENEILKRASAGAFYWVHRDIWELTSSEKKYWADRAILRLGEHPPKMTYTFIAERCSDLPSGYDCPVMTTN